MGTDKPEQTQVNEPRTRAHSDPQLTREVHALDCKLRRTKDATKRMWLQSLKEKLENGIPAKDIQRHLEVMG